MPRQFDIPFQDEPSGDVFVARTIDSFGRLKSAFFRGREPPRAHNLVLIQNGERLVSAGGDRWHLTAILGIAGTGEHRNLFSLVGGFETLGR